MQWYKILGDLAQTSRHTAPSSITSFNKCIGDDTKAAARQSLNCIKNKKNKIWQKTIFNVVEGILTPCNVACGSGIVTVNSPSGRLAVPCNVAGGSGLTCHWIRPNVRHIGIYIWFRFRPHHRSRHVILLQSPKFYPNRTTLGRKKWRHVDFQDGESQPSWISWINNGFLESLIT